MPPGRIASGTLPADETDRDLAQRAVAAETEHRLAAAGAARFGGERRGVAAARWWAATATSKPAGGEQVARSRGRAPPQRRPPPEAGFQIRSAGRVTRERRGEMRLAVDCHQSEPVRTAAQKRVGADELRRDPEVPVGALGRHPPARRALQEAFLDQERLVDVLERAAVLADRGGDRLDAGGTALVVLDQRDQDLAVDLVEAELVDLEQSRARAAPRRRRCEPSPSTCAKSRTRRSRRLAMRGVPRLRPAIVELPSLVERDREQARRAHQDLRPGDRDGRSRADGRCRSARAAAR